MICTYRYKLLLAIIFEKFQNKCTKKCELDLAPFLSGPGLAWGTCSKKTEIESELLKDVDMLLMV